MRPFATPPQPQPVQNFLTKEVCQLTPLAASFGATPAHCAQIAAICNQPLVYDLIFAERLGGAPYPIERAQEFFQWASRGWDEGTHFVFAVVRPSGEIIAAIDIKSAERDGAEIGYWANADAPGVMTNAVQALCDLAQATGYRQLYALVRPDNERSAQVLLRAGFVEHGVSMRNEKPYRTFKRALAGASAPTDSG